MKTSHDIRGKDKMIYCPDLHHTFYHLKAGNLSYKTVCNNLCIYWETNEKVAHEQSEKHPAHSSV